MQSIMMQNIIRNRRNSTQIGSAMMVGKISQLVHIYHLVLAQGIVSVSGFVLYCFYEFAGILFCTQPSRINDALQNCFNFLNGNFFPGSRFALMEVKALLYYLLLNFSFEANEKTEIPLEIKKSPMVLAPKNGLFIELKPRS